MTPPDIFQLGTALNALYPLAGSNLSPELPALSLPAGFMPAGPIIINDSVLVIRKWSFTGYHFESIDEDLLFILGTHNWQEWFRDFEVALREVQFVDGVHEIVEFGFAHCFGGTYLPGGKLLADFVNEQSARKLTLVCHSLGCSIGKIAARCGIAAGRPVRLVAFAPPCTGMEPFEKVVSAGVTPDSAILINERDLVTKGPVPYAQSAGDVVHRFNSDTLDVPNDAENWHNMATYLKGVQQFSQ